MEEELLLLVKRNENERLRNYVQNLDINKFCSELHKICEKEDGYSLLQNFFRGLSNRAICQEKRTKVLMEVLNILQKKLISPRLSNRVICVLAAELDNLSTANLVKLTNSCLQLMQNGKEGDGINCWKDLLPRLLSIIVEKESVEYDGTVLSGIEFKNEIVTAICVNDLQAHVVTSAASMFIDMPLSPEEHLKVVNKLCKSIWKLKLDEIPPLVHQILQLTKEKNSMPLFITLAEFFNSNLYGHISMESETTVSQIEPEGGLPLKELQIVQGTILYHITNCLTSGPESVKDFLKTLSDCLHQPQFVLQPFFVTVLLSISSSSCTFEEEVSNIMKAAILRCISEEEKVSESAWMESVVPITFKIENTLNKVIQICYRDTDRILKGLVDLAFSLLEIVKTRGKDSHCETIWNLGTTMLVNLVQKYPQVTDTVFKNLVNQISQVYELTQFTDCLTKIAIKKPLSMLDCSAVIMQLLGNVCVRLPGVFGQRVVAAIMPLTKMSPSLRDNVIIFLRKAMFSFDFSDQSSREMAVYGFLELMKDLKITDMRALSQSMSQNYVAITQIYSGTYSTVGAVSNEGLCLEILSILKQVFEDEYQVKMVLYKGVYDCFYANPKLGTHILENLKSQLDKFYRDNETPPLDFENCVTCQDSSVVIHEPLPHLVLAVALIAGKTVDDFNGKCKFNETLDSICERMAESDIPHFGFEKEPTQNFVEELPENQLKQEKIRQILGVYEALMGYVLCTWNKDSLEHGRRLNSLFKGFSRLLDYSRNLGKLDKKKIADDNKKVGQKDEQKSKDKPKFKPPPTVLNFKCASRLLSVLNGAPVNWASEESTELVKGKRDLHRYAFNITFELISQARLMSPSELSRSKYMLQYVSSVGRVLYLRCISRLSEVKGFDSQSAILALECFSELLNLVCTNFKPKLSIFFTEIGVSKGDLKEQLKTVLDEVLTQLKDILNDDLEEESKEETQTKKILLLLISIASFLTGHLDREGPQLSQVLNKIKGLCKDLKVQNPNVARALLSLLLNVYMKYKASGALILDLSLCLCESIPLIDEEMAVETHEEYAIINDKTANSCLISICEAVRSMVVEVEWMLSRFKAELSILSFPMEEPMESRQESLEEREREMCRHLNFCIKILSTICTIAVPPGTLADTVLREIGNLYNKLILVTKYFMVKITNHHQTLQSTRFEKTLKLADHELTKNMYCLTEHVLSEGAASTEDPQLKKQKKESDTLRNKVLKETKIIPKVIYEKEQFQKFSLQLLNKAKAYLEMKHLMARDFRLYAKQVKELVEKENIYMEDDVMEVDEESQSESTQASKRARTQE